MEDCHAAANMMPAGEYIDSGFTQTGEPTYSIAQAGREQKSLPAVFIAGSCMIEIRVMSWSKMERPPPPLEGTPLASAMYFKVWPAIKWGADRVNRKCRRPLRVSNKYEEPGEKRGDERVYVTIEGRRFDIRVRIRNSQIEPGHWASHLSDDSRDLNWNIYRETKNTTAERRRQENEKWRRQEADEWEWRSLYGNKKMLPYYAGLKVEQYKWRK